jgi:hypothetical protein
MIGRNAITAQSRERPQWHLRLLTAAFAGDPARVDDIIVLSEIAADRGGMDLEQAGRPRTRSLTLVTLRHFCLRIALSSRLGRVR